MNKIIQHLKNGGVIAYPTETVWGLGCLISNESSIQRILDIKQRPEGQPLSVLVKDIDQAESIADFSGSFGEEIKKIVNQFWPGPLTFVLPARKKVSCKITKAVEESEKSGAREIGLRCSSLPSLQKLMEKVPEGLISTSANLSSQPPAKSVDDLDWLPDDVMVVDLERSVEQDNIGSTVIRIFNKDPLIWQVLRYGDLDVMELEKRGLLLKQL